MVDSLVHSPQPRQSDWTLVQLRTQNLSRFQCVSAGSAGSFSADYGQSLEDRISISDLNSLKVLDKKSMTCSRFTFAQIQCVSAGSTSSFNAELSPRQCFINHLPKPDPISSISQVAQKRKPQENAQASSKPSGSVCLSRLNRRIQAHKLTAKHGLNFPNLISKNSKKKKN